MNQSHRKLVVAGSLFGIAALQSVAVKAQVYACAWEWEYCLTQAGGTGFCLEEQSGGGVTYFHCCDEEGFLYDGYCC